MDVAPLYSYGPGKMLPQSRVLMGSVLQNVCACVWLEKVLSFAYAREHIRMHCNVLDAFEGGTTNAIRRTSMGSVLPAAVLPACWKS